MSGCWSLLIGSGPKMPCGGVWSLKPGDGRVWQDMLWEEDVLQDGTQNKRDDRGGDYSGTLEKKVCGEPCWWAWLGTAPNTLEASLDEERLHMVTAQGPLLREAPRPACGSPALEGGSGLCLASWLRREEAFWGWMEFVIVWGAGTRHPLAA